MPEVIGSKRVGRIVLLSVVTLLVVAVDLVTKSGAETFLTAHASVELTSFFDLRLGYNRGISFGLLQATSQAAPGVIVAAQSLIVAGLFVLAARSASSLQRVAASLILGGALGNVIDRVGDGAVTDFLDLHISGLHWPTFNLADIAITIGAGLWILVSISSRRAQ